MNTVSTTEDTEMFIEKVREHSILYDLKHPGYKNLRKKDKIWDSIGSEFGMDGDTAKKKWKNLRDTYSKYLKSMKTTTGQATKKNYSKWQWAEQMVFLKPYLTFAKTINNIADNSENEITAQSSTQNVAIDNNESELLYSEPVTQTSAEAISAQNSPISNISPAAKRSLGSADSLTQKNKNKDTPVNQVLQYFQSKSQRRSQSQMDDLEHIFLGYAKSVKKLSLRRQTIIKMKLAQIIAEQELSEIDENTRMSPYDSSSATNFSDCGNYSNASSITSANILQPIINRISSSTPADIPNFSNYLNYSNIHSKNNTEITTATDTGHEELTDINEEAVLADNASAAAEYFKSFSSL